MGSRARATKKLYIYKKQYILKLNKETYLLKYTDIPFSFAIISIITGISWNDLSSISTLLLFGGMLSTLLEVLDIPKFLFWLYVSKLTYIKSAVMDVDLDNSADQIKAAAMIYDYPRNKIKVIDCARKAYNLEPLLKTKEKLVGMLYLMILLVAIGIFGKNACNILISKLNFQIYPIFLQLFMGVLIIPVVIKFIFGLRRLPGRVFLLCLYILKEQGVLSLAIIPDYEPALMADDWTVAQSLRENPRLSSKFTLFLTPEDHAHERVP